VGAPVLYFLDPLSVSLFQSIIREVLVGSFSFTFLKTMALNMPFIASGEARIVERWSGPVHSFVEYKTIVSAANPVFVWIRISDERT
jgi:hypothetical protein